MLCLNSLTRGAAPLDPCSGSRGLKSTFRNAWSKFCSIVPNILLRELPTLDLNSRKIISRRIFPVVIVSHAEPRTKPTRLYSPVFERRRHYVDVDRFSDDDDDEAVGEDRFGWTYDGETMSRICIQRQKFSLKMV